jgi:hypothetical protein
MHVCNAINASDVRARVDDCFVNAPMRGTVTIFGKPGQIRRDALWFARYASDGHFPLYRTYNTAYGDPRTTTGVRDAIPPMPMPSWMSALLDDVSVRYGLPCLNHVVLHRYVDGADTIGMHHDKTMDLHPDSTIVSLSLGTPRDFRVGTSTFVVKDGDAVFLPYEVNRTVKHGVPPRAHAGLRYSITARTIRTFSNGTTHRVEQTPERCGVATQPCAQLVGHRCAADTRCGARCKRAAGDSGVCWQHRGAHV